MAVPRLKMDESELFRRRSRPPPGCSDETGDYAYVGPRAAELAARGESAATTTAAAATAVDYDQVEPPRKVTQTARLNELTSGGRGQPQARATGKQVTMPLGEAACTRCEVGFDPCEQIVNSAGELWHPECFVCAQCFQAFPEGVFYEFEGRKYCEHDFQVLFAPCCQQCNEFIIGRVIKAMSASWHPACFRCNMCSKELADLGFIKNGNQALCHECNARIRLQGTGRYMCHKCHAVIDKEPLRFRGELYHPYHFNCKACGIELDSRAREVKSRAGYTSVELNELYCLRCHDKMGIPICGACHRPIEERVVTALGKHWHVEHFVCAKCEKPFLGHRHYEKKGQAYCRTDYHLLFGNICFICNLVVEDEVVRSLNKAWCPHHFACSTCDQPLTRKSKFFEMDMKPVCKKCYERLPHELRRRLKRLHENEAPGMVSGEFMEAE